MNEAIKLAIEKGGYEPMPSEFTMSPMVTYSNPLFWQALGKALEKPDSQWSGDQEIMQFWWKDTWHGFIDWIAEEKSPDEFFNQLLK